MNVSQYVRGEPYVFNPDEIDGLIFDMKDPTKFNAGTAHRIVAFAKKLNNAAMILGVPVVESLVGKERLDEFAAALKDYHERVQFNFGGQ